MKTKHLIKLFVLGLTFAGLTAGLLQWPGTRSAAEKLSLLLGDNAWTGAASGSWNTTDANWTNPTVWNNANSDSAIFGATGAGPVTTTVPITLRGMRFDANGYSVTAPASLTFSAGGGGSLAPGEIQVATDVSVQINNKLSGSVGLTKTGGGTLVLSNTDTSDYTGTTTISAGKLQLGFGLSGSGNGQIPDNPVSMAGGTTLEFRRANTYTFGGQISGNGNLVKAGTGTVTLSASGNRMSSLTVNDGTLATTGSDSAMSVANVNGGTFRPTGGGFISQLNVSGGALAPETFTACEELNVSAGVVAMGCNAASPYKLTATGGTISPGGQGPGTVIPNRGTLNPATTLHIEIDQNGPDKLVAFAFAGFPVNNINLGGAQLTGALTNGFNPAPGQQFDIVSKGGLISGVGSITGQFAQGNQVVFSGRRFSITYSSNNVTLTALQATNAPFDFDGDNKTDIGIFRPSVGQWWYQKSSDNSVLALEFGQSTDRIVPADYTGDGKTDVAFWRPSTAQWFVLRSEDYTYYAFPFGVNGDIPVPGDFDADGKADPTVFRPSAGTWFISKTTGGTDVIGFGQVGDVPVIGDYDGDRKADVAIYRPSNGQWWLYRSTAGVIAFAFGNSTDKPVQGDYTGDARTDVAFWRPSTGEWFVLRSEDISSYYSVPFGTAGDVPTPGDYDGDGKFDTAVFRPSNATWYVNRSTSGTLIQQFGQAGDTAVPSAFVP